MLGHSHALSGLAVGAATLPFAPVAGPAEQVAWVAAWAGFALLPDLDWRHGSSIAGMWGPLSAVPARIIGMLARGHRNGTHDPLLGPAAFGGLAVLAGDAAWSQLLLVALTIGVTLRALTFVLPADSEGAAFVNTVISWVGAYLLLRHGPAPPWLPVVVAGGAAVHIAGDALTVGGVPLPFSWLFGRSSRMSLGLFRTGSAVETALLAPAFLLLALWQLCDHTAAGRLAAAAVAAVT
jgi:membrane-bound metal-dependent hydrolase YbcI (DUF457 family)